MKLHKFWDVLPFQASLSSRTFHRPWFSNFLFCIWKYYNFSSCFQLNISSISISVFSASSLTVNKNLVSFITVVGLVILNITVVHPLVSLLLLLLLVPHGNLQYLLVQPQPLLLLHHHLHEGLLRVLPGLALELKQNFWSRICWQWVYSFSVLRSPSKYTTTVFIILCEGKSIVWVKV